MSNICRIPDGDRQLLDSAEVLFTNDPTVVRALSRQLDFESVLREAVCWREADIVPLSCVCSTTWRTTMLTYRVSDA